MPGQLGNTEVQSPRWYSLKLYELDANFYLVRIDALDRVLDEMLALDDVPVRVRLRLYVYKAKVHSIRMEEKQAQAYKNKAGHLLAQLVKRSQYPKAIIDYANFQIYLKDYDEGIRTLKMLEFNLRGRDDFDLNTQIYTNLGNLHKHKKLLDEALSYYRLANENAKQTDNGYYHFMTRYNLARGHQFLDQFDTALELFAEVLESVKTQDNKHRVSLCHMRMGQILLAQNQSQQALSHLQAVDAPSLPGSTREEFLKLLEQAKL